MSSPRVLSIQSHVVHGHVGNKSAVFPLQLLGFDVDPLHTVQFSNHTGYGRWGGSVQDAEHIAQVVDALEANDLLHYSHLLTGYARGPEALKTISNVADRLRARNTSLVYVLDPVLGDDGKLYVSPDCIPVYKSLLPKATVSTPNSFEAELLTGVKITSRESLKACLAAFHEQYKLAHIVVSSCSLDDSGKMLVCAGSSIDGESFMIEFPRRAEYFQGVGDLFSAMICARFDGSRPLPQVAELAIASLQGVISATRDHALKVASVSLVPSEDETHEQRIARLRAVELRLVQSADIIRSPPLDYRARPI